MVKLSAIIENVKTIRVVGSTESAITSLRMDSRKVAPDSLFFAIKGLTSDGHNFIPQAIETGAVAVVCENIPETQQEGVTYLQVDDALVAMAVCASSFFGNPSESISLIGVTGTNGKTTIATLLFKLFRAMGYRCGLISTVRNMIDDIEIPSTHTTPDVIMLNSLLAGMVEAGCAYCFIEVSSHATEQKRVYGLTFSGGIFTNITHDHLDYHGTFANYLKAKQRFFEMLGADAFALFNNDDRNGQIMLQTCRADKYSYGLKTAVDYKCRVVENHFDGQLLNVNGEEVWTRLIGEFNAYNFTAIYAAATLVGLKPVEFLPALSNLTAVEGRFQYFMGTGGIVGIVDYAHTPDALTNVIETINGIRKSGSSLITVIGCGGDRDAAKRPDRKSTR
ncbi:MAG: UDP-N-acetylmuramoyl-L-alanyl-D-glutamate--2,6-diaminopimelate ligase, partial [Bacteroidetes bacterium]|nr:UDP-N-acetylmuramoyl-L-alanyl-D-glutamate--2,6-diaminopimelate ligase [Bacteroidota bacterium]